MILGNAATFLALSLLIQILLELILSSDFIGYISGDRSLDIVELSETLVRDHALCVQFVLPLSGSGSLALLHHLVLGEDVRLARHVRSWATLAGSARLLQLFESASL